MIDHGLAALRLAQLVKDPGDGESVPAAGRVSARAMAEYCGVSPETINRIERLALAKMAAGLEARMPADVWAELFGRRRKAGGNPGHSKPSNR